MSSIKILSKLHFLLIAPRNFFKETVDSTEYKTKDLYWLLLIMVFIMLFLELIKSSFLQTYLINLADLIYIIGFVLGIIISFVIRVYLIKLLLNKFDVIIKYQQIGVIIGLALIPYIIGTAIGLLINTDIYNLQINIVSSIWNLALIAIGIQVISKLSFARTAVVVLIMFSFEQMLILIFYGIRL